MSHKPFKTRSINYDLALSSIFFVLPEWVLLTIPPGARLG